MGERQPDKITTFEAKKEHAIPLVSLTPNQEIDSFSNYYKCKGKQVTKISDR